MQYHTPDFSTGCCALVGAPDDDGSADECVAATVSFREEFTAQGHLHLQWKTKLS
ncbi:hypothetical protein H6F77_14015 [Microcoleus sp. FACHB-831]|uniref:hypothetical protein n=1 Tax=Microcoleus sp. FACHB-831 TaxID=2692827 RepID=UPI0016887F28|nr:hypothetical protein [Microcoleus sp. FACHB-831]MBD1922199.1 hypothetical protein [Microcoleus sp. FACHB-831]